MKTKLFLTMIIVALAMTSFNNSYAQDEEINCRELLKELHTDFYENNILPQKLEWKEKIDNALSTDDKAKLDALRAEAREIHSEIKAKIMEIKNEKMTWEERRNAMKELRETYGTRIHEIHEEIKTIWESYEELLAEIKEEQKEVYTKWYSDKIEMMKNFCEEYPICCEKLKKWDKRKERKGKHGKKDQDTKKKGSKFHSEGGFNCEFGKHFCHKKGHGMELIDIWLFDGNIDIDDNNEILLNINDVPDNLKMITSPNPSSESSETSFFLEKSINGKIELIDSNGNLIKTLSEGILNSGNNSFIVNTSNLNTGTYFIRLETNEYTEINKIIIR